MFNSVDPNKTCNKSILDKRTEADLSKDTIKAIRTMTFNMETLPVGTFKYKIFKYPSDIDIFENLESCCTYNVSRFNASNTIQSIILNILENKDFIFTDFKAGYDTRFKIYTCIIS